MGAIIRDLVRHHFSFLDISRLFEEEKKLITLPDEIQKKIDNYQGACNSYASKLAENNSSIKEIAEELSRAEADLFKVEQKRENQRNEITKLETLCFGAPLAIIFNSITNRMPESIALDCCSCSVPSVLRILTCVLVPSQTRSRSVPTVQDIMSSGVGYC